MVSDRLVTLGLLAVVIAIGLALSRRIGLGSPFVESWVRGRPAPRRFRGVFALGALVGLGGAVLVVALDLGVFRQPMLSQFRELGIELPAEAVAPPLYGLLAAFSAGITEETLFRLFGLSLLAWLGGLLVRTADGRPAPAVLWTANVLFALAFAAVHLSTASAIGWPMSALVLTRTFVLNSLCGLAFGWLFFTYGLESAMLAHFFTDVGLYTLLPIVIQQPGRQARLVAGGAVALALLAGMAWAVRTIARESAPAGRAGPAGEESEQ
jgi:hypothetical protein